MILIRCINIKLCVYYFTGDEISSFKIIKKRFLFVFVLYFFLGGGGGGGGADQWPSG